eukprot:g46871.t1
MCRQMGLVYNGIMVGTDMVGQKACSYAVLFYVYVLFIFHNVVFSTLGLNVEFIIITKEAVLGKLMGLKVDRSPGPDEIHPRVLKEVMGEIANAL